MRENPRTPEKNLANLRALFHRPDERMWLEIDAVLLEGHGKELDPAPGRRILVGPGAPFAQLSETLERVFGRWDQAHMHSFDFESGLMLGHAEQPEDELGTVDDRVIYLTQALRPDDVFSYTFDFGDNWRHRLTVRAAATEDLQDWLEQTGETPQHPTAVWGWGNIPDQYLRSEYSESLEDTFREHNAEIRRRRAAGEYD